jgi:hypothetical protein
VSAYKRHLKILTDPVLRAERVEFVRLNPEYFLEISERTERRLREQIVMLNKRVDAYRRERMAEK